MFAEILKNALLVLVLDIPWLYTISGWSGAVVRGIQGSPMEFRMWPAIPVYLALGYLLTLAESAKGAFFLGLSTYAVYDFTNLATFKKYPLEFAAADSLWGGTLMTLAWYVRKMV